MKKAISLLIISIIIISIVPFAFVGHAKGATTPTVTLSPSSNNPSQLNEVFEVQILISDVENLWGWHADLSWDPTRLMMTEAPEQGDLFSSYPSFFVAPAESVKNDLGTVFGGVSDTITTDNSVSGSGLLATLRFKIIKQCIDTPITLGNLSLQKPNPPGSDAGKTHDIINPASTTVTATASLIIPGAPSADAGEDQTVAEHTTVTFDASKSISTGEDTTYTWSFTDGTQKTLTGKTATYTFDKQGTYEVTLTVHDSLGENSAIVTITVTDQTPPTAVITYQDHPVTEPIVIDVNQPITLDGTDSSDPNGGTINYYRWEFDYVNPIPAVLENTCTKTFVAPGICLVTLTVKDVSGNAANKTITINVGNVDSTDNPTPTPNQGADPTDGTPTATPGSSRPTNAPSAVLSSNLPPTVLSILIVVTVFVLVGSFFWLRNKNLTLPTSSI